MAWSGVPQSVGVGVDVGVIVGTSSGYHFGSVELCGPDAVTLSLFHNAMST